MSWPGHTKLDNIVDAILISISSASTKAPHHPPLQPSIPRNSMIRPGVLFEMNNPDKINKRAEEGPVCNAFVAEGTDQVRKPADHAIDEICPEQLAWDIGFISQYYNHMFEEGFPISAPEVSG